MAMKDYRILPKGAPKQLVVLLHGVGANGEDLLDLGQVWQSVLPDCAFISPDAPNPFDMAPFGHQWFSLQDRTPEKMLEGMRKVKPVVEAYLDGLMTEFSLPASKVALVGFSQGTMVSLYTAPRRAQPFAGVLGFSGALIDAEHLHAETKSRPPICLVHGKEDEVVPAMASQIAHQTFQAEGFTSELHILDHLPHSIDNRGLKLGAAFLQRILA